MDNDQRRHDRAKRLPRRNAAPRPRRGRPLGLLALGLLGGLALGVVLTGTGGVRLTSRSGAQELIVGRPSVIDGDTLDIRGTRIRLSGVDAPESDQLCEDAAGGSYRCGKTSAFALADWIGARNVSCASEGQDQYGRTLARCRLGGADVGDWMVRHGHAVDYRRYSRGAYAAAEREARDGRRGVWAGRFTLPADWRRANREGR